MPQARPELGPSVRAIMTCIACAAGLLSALLPLLPVAVRHVTASTAKSGLVTAALSVSTVFIELQTPIFLARSSVRAVVAVGFALIGGALAGLALLPSFLVMICLGVVFGLGFGLIVTAGSTVIGGFEGARREKALVLYALSAALPMIAAPPLALIALPTLGLSGVFSAATAVAVIGTIAAIRAPRHAGPPATAVRRLRALRNPRVGIPLIAFVCVSLTFGGVATIAPLALKGSGARSAAAFFLVLGVFRLAGRSASAILFRRLSPGTVLLGGTVWAAVGLACLAARAAGLDLLAAVWFGGGLGAVQTASFVVMLDDSHPGEVGSIPALWNVGIDGGTGLGALVAAPLAVALGYRATFLAMAGLLLAGAALRLGQDRRNIASGAIRAGDRLA